MLTDTGKACIRAGVATIEHLEGELAEVLGERGHQQLRTMLLKLLDSS